MPRTTALHAFIEQLAGGTVNIVLTQVAVGAGSTPLLQSNFERVAAVIINSGSTSIVVAPNRQVGLTTGILLGANGGGVSLNAKDDLALVGWNWEGLAPSGAGTATVMEIIRINATVGDTMRAP